MTGHSTSRPLQSLALVAAVSLIAATGAQAHQN
jgi:hypothetical protein